MSGKLSVIGTPIGNLKDITLRALETLDSVDVLVCEDSRVTSHLINTYVEQGLLHTKPRYMVCNEFNEARVAPDIVGLVRAGQHVGLVSDAGMPALSDPGYRVIRGCYDEGLIVEVIPGVSSLTTAMVVAGLGGEQALYVGFLPKKSGKRHDLLQSAKIYMETVPSMRFVVFVSPHKLERELKEIRDVMGNAKAVLVRELTKKFEERIESTLDELIVKYEKQSPKGEIVLVVGNN
jgi:16S rRNA (cytidine1402-2'-O)-methyltransferase